MSGTNTQTQTFTVADIRKVVDSFAADYLMAGESTGLRTLSEVQSTVADLKIFAESRYLDEITLILRDKDGKEIKGAKYEVSTSASGWGNDRPGNALWPRTAGGSLRVVATLNSSWWNMTDDQRAAFRTRTGLSGPWSVTTDDTSMSSLTKSSGQQYSSRGYGLERSNYS